MNTQVSSQNQFNNVPTIPQRPVNKTSNLSLLKNKKILMFGGILILLIALLIGGAFAIFNKPKKKVIPQSPVTITFWGKSISEDVMADIISGFETENPLIKVQYIKESDTDYKSRAQTRLSLKNPTNLPDILEVEEPWIDEFVKELYPIQDPKIFSRFTGQMVNNTKVAGTNYGIPFKFDALALAYNKNHLSEMGYAENDLNKLDWSLLESRAKSVTKTKQTKVGNTEITEIVRAGMAVGNPKTVKNADKILQLLLLENDAKIYDANTKTYKVDAKFESVTTFYSKFMSDTIWDDTLGGDIEAFSKEKVSMVLVRAQDIDIIEKTNPNLDFVTVLPPIISGVRNLSLSTSLVLPKAKTNYNQSLKFLEYISRPEISYKLHESEKNEVFLPSPIESLNKIPATSHYAVFANISPVAEKFQTSNYDEASKLITNFLENGYATYNKKSSNPRFEFSFKSLENSLNQIGKK